MGLNQLKRLNNNIKLRNRNFNYFIKNLKNEFFHKEFQTKGISNYAFPIILKKTNLNNRNIFEKYLVKKGIEFIILNEGV